LLLLQSDAVYVYYYLANLRDYRVSVSWC